MTRINQELDQFIQKNTKEFIALQENWDGEGAKKINKETIQRVDYFLNDLRYEYKIPLLNYELPDLFPGHDGEIEVHWKNEKLEFIAIIPGNSMDAISFLAIIKSGQKIKGSVTI